LGPGTLAFSAAGTCKGEPARYAGRRREGGAALRGGFKRTALQGRLFLVAIAATLVLLFMGMGELGRCLRAIVGPTSVSYAQMTQTGLAGYGYVRVTEATPALDRSMLVLRAPREGRTGHAEVIGGYTPVDPAPPAKSEDATATGRQISGARVAAASAHRG
jgi:hypothetical protein